MKHFYILILFLLSSLVSLAQLNPPAELQDYYSGVDFSLTGTPLYDDLATITISKHTTLLSYSQRHDYLYDADEDLANASNVILIYSGESRYELEYESINNPYTPQTFNTEHIYLRSLLDDPNGEGDLHNLRTCDININTSRGSDPFTSGSGAYNSTGSGWYPGDDWKGDVARIVLYVNLRYNEPISDVGDLALFLQWNAEDPVSPLEDQRNTVISGVQGNRNPFIDNPYIATVIWGGPNAENRWSALSDSDLSVNEIKMYPNPSNNNFVYFSSSQDLKVIIYDVLGKQVKIENINSNKDFINISLLQKGIYVVRLISENGSITKKLIKQ
jgi:endonuclease I